jgi:hypothetical protein
MGRKLISKPQGLVSSLLKSLREFGYISVGCASVLGVLVLFATPDPGPPAKSPPPAAKNNR